MSAKQPHDYERLPLENSYPDDNMLDAIILHCARVWGLSAATEEYRERLISECILVWNHGIEWYKNDMGVSIDLSLSLTMCLVNPVIMNRDDCYITYSAAIDWYKEHDAK